MNWRQAAVVLLRCASETLSLLVMAYFYNSRNGVVAEESGIAGLTPISNQPFDLDIHEIPAFGAEPTHEHYDVRYLFAAPNGATARISSESNELRWFTLEQAQRQNLDRGLLRMIARLKSTLIP